MRRANAATNVTLHKPRNGVTAEADVVTAETELLDKKIAKELEAESIKASTPPFATFADLWHLMLRNTDAQEMSDDISGLMGTIGVVAALLMSFMFGQNGKDLSASPNSLWGDHVHVAQDIYTLLSAVVAVLCFATVCVSSRIYMDVLLAPKVLTTAAVAAIGGNIIIEMIYLPFFIITVGVLLVITLHVTITLPAGFGVATLMVVVVVAALSIATFVTTDKAVAKLVLLYQERKKEAQVRQLKEEL